MSSSDAPISTHVIPPQVKQPAKLTEEERQRASLVQSQNLCTLLLKSCYDADNMHSAGDTECSGTKGRNARHCASSG